VHPPHNGVLPGPKEHHKTVCFRELAVFSPCDDLFRKSAKNINRLLWRKEEQMVQARTRANLVEREGEAIAACVENKAKTILKCHQFTDEGVPMGETSAYNLLANESVFSKQRVSQAIGYLRSLHPDDIKDAEHIEKLIGYFSRNLSFIPCYALRQKLGLRVSSNPVEKANDLLVSNRQKHHGMSWSASGSNSLATLTSVHRNDEHMQWLRHHDIRFTFSQQKRAQSAA